MTNFIAEFLELIEDNVPQLADKIQHGAVDAETPRPYAAYTMPTSEPLRTIHGIAGWRSTFDFTLVGERLAELDDLARKIIAIVENDRIDGRVCQIQNKETAFFAEVGLDGIILTFKIS